ncbi:hypothetical protein [Roseateles saccharophilus]|uniref:DUF3024 family protein n=1 Tax=Roseateles saccharophilus TaxID=304 RepID=A0A4V2VSR3_ROSSA|nr:hypothetical protein [Roseateles saccharophilus]MDG0832032.1 hypothetical protein [Roseateles saccharophilus]TCV03440.1 hypothetical protein EV671_100395 [Roseateles saccharophilus]
MNTGHGLTQAHDGGAVLSLDAARIERALDQRSRYRYVRPYLAREGDGWKIVSPNCSRNVDPQGGEIDIAWLVPHDAGWLLFARDHAQGGWRLNRQGPLTKLLALLCADPAREFWQ